MYEHKCDVTVRKLNWNKFVRSMIECTQKRIDSEWICYKCIFGWCIDNIDIFNNPMMNERLFYNIKYVYIKHTQYKCT